MEIHWAAKEGFTDGYAYDSYRPPYKETLITKVKSALNLQKAAANGVLYDVLELGAGTGKFTRTLAPELAEKGRRYLATDPSVSFIAALQKHLPGMETVTCSAANIPLPDCSVQNIICATCFHWFADEKSLTEMKRVLAVGGKLILVWVNYEMDKLDWVRDLGTIIEKYRGNAPLAHFHNWEKIIEDFPGLQKTEQSIEPDGIKCSKDYVVNLLSTFSIISALSDTAKVEALSGFRTILDKHFPAKDTELVFPLISEFYCLQKTEN